ncbi:MAG: VWA domain-containing protein [Verrucomicrobiales bacterium]|nr:VWA domain-containing protein [Verrucomicrobiales bacterium]
MSFLAPIAFAFAAALPVVVVFYLLKRRRLTRLTSSTVLWQRFLAENQANAPFQKLRKNWLLALQLIALALVVLGLARPYFTGSASPSRLRVLVLDASASMQSTDETPTRFAKAKREALSWIDGLRDGEQGMILLAGAVTEVKQSPTSNKTALRRALESCEPSDGPTRLAEALQTAGAFTFEKRGEEMAVSGEIHLFSDGAATDLGELASKNLPLIYHRIGNRGNNLGIVSLDVRANPENPAERALFVGVSNPTTNIVSTQLELRFNDQVLEIKAITAPATNTLPVVFISKQEIDGLFTVKLLGQDDLAADDQASVYSILPQPVNILLVTRGNRFLEKGLRGAAHARLTVRDSVTETDDQFDLVVLDDILPRAWPKANLLAIRVAPTNWFEQMDSAKAPAIVDWHHTHPLMRYVSFDNVDVAESLLPKLPPWGLSVVQSQQRPMIVAGERDRHRIVWLGFDPLQSNWPLRVSFPIFLANAVEWLNPSLSRSSELMVRAGEPLRWRSRQPVSEAVITPPKGKAIHLSLAPNSQELLYGATQHQGPYQIRTGTNLVTFCVNLLDAEETRTMPQETLPIGKYAGVASNVTQVAGKELWRWLAAFALGVVLFEWWFFHKRTA